MRALLAVVLLLLSVVPASAQANCGQTLQSLIDGAANGATVLVPACVYHENVFVGHAITLDGQNAAVVDGDNVRDRWFWINASNVTIRNFTMRNAATVLQEGAIATAANISNIVIDHNVLGPTKNGSAVGIGGTTDSRVTNNDISGAGQLGIETYLDTRLLIQGNHLHGNNTAPVDWHFGAGGLKAVSETDLRVLGNEVDHNAGAGLWCDIMCTGVTIANNVVHDQSINPIFYEVSSNAEIFGNTVTSSMGDVWGCITVSSSANVNVHDNGCSDSTPVRAQLENRNDKPANAGHGIVLQNNRAVRPTPNQATSWWQYDPAGPLVPGQNGNLDIGNVVVSSLATPTPTPTAIVPLPTPTITCQIEIWLNGVSQGRKSC